MTTMNATAARRATAAYRLLEESAPRIREALARVPFQLPEFELTVPGNSVAELQEAYAKADAWTENPNGRGDAQAWVDARGANPGQEDVYLAARDLAERWRQLVRAALITAQGIKPLSTIDRRMVDAYLETMDRTLAGGPYTLPVSY